MKTLDMSRSPFYSIFPGPRGEFLQANRGAAQNQGDLEAEPPVLFAYLKMEELHFTLNQKNNASTSFAMALARPVGIAAPTKIITAKMRFERLRQSGLCAEQRISENAGNT